MESLKSSQMDNISDYSSIKDETNKIFIDAFRDFGFSDKQYRLYIEITDNNNIDGRAYLEQKKITFTRGLRTSKAIAEFAAYHEVAHCCDNKLRFWNKYIDPVIVSSCFMSTIIFTVVSNYMVNKFFPNLTKLNPNSIRGNLGLYIIGSFMSIPIIPYIVRNFKYQFEHRANIAACKKLIQNNKLDGIAESLIRLKVMQLFLGLKRTHFNHPPIQEEFEEIESCLRNHNYYVMMTYSPKKINLVIKKMNKEIINCTAEY